MSAINKIIPLSILLLGLVNTGYAQTFTVAGGPVMGQVSDSRSVNFIDLNNDGWEDLYISNGLQGGQKDLLYLNDGTGQFVEITDMSIVQASYPSDGASFADYNNDGWLDGIVTSWYGAADLLYLNNGEGILEYKNNAGIASGSFAETAAFGDYDNDGWLDLYVTDSGSEGANFLYRNLQNGAFLRIENHVLVADPKPSRGAIWGDFNNDGILDLFVANEGGQSNDLFQGTGSGGFEKLAEGSIVTSEKSTMTASWGDIDNDGDLDLFAGNSNFFRPLDNQIFINTGDGFEEVAEGPIVEALNCTFGSAFGDYDNDGDLDLVISNGFCNASLENALYENQGDGTFVDVSSAFEVNNAVCSYGVAWGDIDNDGFLDLAFANCKNSSTSSEEPNLLLHNEGNDNNWLKIQLEGLTSNRSAVGARIRMKATISSQPVWQMREISTQSGYAGQSSLTAHFGLGDATAVDSLIISWPAGNRQILTNLTPNQLLSVTEVINIGREDTPDEASPFSIELYPNPTTDLTHTRIRITAPASSKAIMRVYNTMGQLVLQKEINLDRGSLSFPPPETPLAAGVYHVIIQSSTHQQSARLVLL